MKPIKVFLDFDEMLAHTFYADNEAHADQIMEDYSEHWYGEKYNIRHDGWYVTFKRAWTDDLITFLNELVGKDNVYILTTGTLDYIRWANIKINLGFDPNTNIFGREDMYLVKTHPNFKHTFNILIDDRSYEYHTLNYNGKINFLNKLPYDQYIRAKKFTVWCESLGYETEYVNNLKSEIVEMMKLNN